MAECDRCHERESELETRKQFFCRKCFVQFIERDVQRAIRPLNLNIDWDENAPPPPLVVLPLSFGKSSLVLGHLLQSWTERQKSRNMGRHSVRGCCVYVGEKPDLTTWPFPDWPLYVVDRPEMPEQPLNRSARQDLYHILVERAIENAAAQLSATAIFWGHSTTRVSELVLGETVKGRGAQIPDMITRNYPLGTVSSYEVQQYVAIFPELKDMIQPDPPVSGITKLRSIDEVIHAYFEDVQQGFPAVVSTVARVASKLAQQSEPCQLCHPDNCAEASARCYGCRAMIGDLELTARANSKDIIKQYTIG